MPEPVNADDAAFQFLLGGELTDEQAYQLGEIWSGAVTLRGYSRTLAGPGIDPTGQVPSSDAINAFFLANIGGMIYIPPGVYVLDKPVTLYGSTVYAGAGRPPVTRNTNSYDQEHTAAWGTRFVASPDFVGYAMFESDTYNNALDIGDELWQWAGIKNVSISGVPVYNEAEEVVNAVPTVGLAVHRMGETSMIEDVHVSRCSYAQIVLTGAHAPCHLRNLTVNGDHISNPLIVTPGTPNVVAEPTYDQRGISLEHHPVYGGNSGTVEISGLSGDGNLGSIVYSSGSCLITVIAPKFENNPFDIITFDGGGIGAGKAEEAGALTLIGGYAQEPSGTGTSFGGKPCESVIRLKEEVTPCITLLGFRTTTAQPDAITNWGYTPMLVKDDDGPGIPIHPGGSAFGKHIITYGDGNSFFGTNIVLGNVAGIFGSRSDGTTHEMLGFGSDLIVQLRAGSANGFELLDSSGVKRFQFDATGLAFNGETPFPRRDITSATPVNHQVVTLLNDLGLATDTTAGVQPVGVSVVSTASLPDASVIGPCIMMVNDSDTPHAGNSGIAIAGGGTYTVLVYSDGVVWRIL